MPAAYATEGSELEVCLFDPKRSPGDGYCGESGSSLVSLGWGNSDYPDVVDYTVTRTAMDGAVEVVVSGSYRLQCQPGTVRLELGVRG